MNNPGRHFANFVHSLVLVVAVTAVGSLFGTVFDSFITFTHLIEPAGVLYNTVMALWFYVTLFAAFSLRFQKRSADTGQSSVDCVLAFLLVAGFLTLMEEGDWTAGHYRGLFTYLAGIVPMLLGKWTGEARRAEEMEANP